jgi:hypothetical protein
MLDIDFGIEVPIVVVGHESGAAEDKVCPVALGLISIGREAAVAYFATGHHLQVDSKMVILLRKESRRQEECCRKKHATEDMEG